MPSFQEILNSVKQILPRRSAEDVPGETGPAPITEAEARIVDQARQTEKSRWTQIVELGVPTAMFVIGLLLTALAQLIGVWGILGFLLVAASPVVYWQLRLERRLVEMTDEIRKNRPVKR